MEVIQAMPDRVAGYQMPLQEVRIQPLGDIQFGAMGCDVALLKEVVQRALDNNCYFVGMGDYVDVASPSNRKLLYSVQGGLYDSVRNMMDDAVRSSVQRLFHEVLEPTQGRWLGMLRGHHYWPFQDGATSDTLLAQLLGTKFLGDCALIIIKLSNGKKVVKAKVWLHHGQGSGQTAAAPLNKLEQVIKTFFAHVYLLGHYHREAAATVPYLDFDITDSGKIRSLMFQRCIVATGGFLRGYEVGTKDPTGFPAGAYPEQRLLTPTALGAPTIRIQPKILKGRVRIHVTATVGG